MKRELGHVLFAGEKVILLTSSQEDQVEMTFPKTCLVSAGDIIRSNISQVGEDFQCDIQLSIRLSPNLVGNSKPSSEERGS